MNNIKEKQRLQLQVGKLAQIPLVVFVQILKVLCCACCNRQIVNEIWEVQDGLWPVAHSILVSIGNVLDIFRDKSPKKGENPSKGLS